MSIITDFDQAASLAVEGNSSPSRKRGRKRPAPFSLRLSETERAQLGLEASGIPLGTYVKAKLLEPSARRGTRGISPQDRLVLGQALALIGRSNFTSSLGMIAAAARAGTLIVTPELEAEIHLALDDIRAVRIALIHALGLKLEDRK